MSVEQRSTEPCDVSTFVPRIKGGKLGMECVECSDGIWESDSSYVHKTDYVALLAKYRRAIWFLQDIAAMSRKIGSETAAHALAQLHGPRERDGD